MKSAIRFAALTLVLASAFGVNSFSHAKTTTNIAAKSAAPVPVCPPGDPNGCGM
jgi:hypothetical protein